MFTPGMVVIEQSVKRPGGNKDWGFERYDAVVRALRDRGHRICRMRKFGNFRQAMAMLSTAAIYIGPEGGLHHAAAALGIPAVVIFGGFISPKVTGYKEHVNLYTGESELGCGASLPCRCCHAALARISVDEVVTAALEQLNDRAIQSKPAAPVLRLLPLARDGEGQGRDRDCDRREQPENEQVAG